MNNSDDKMNELKRNIQRQINRKIFLDNLYNLYGEEINDDDDELL